MIPPTPDRAALRTVLVEDEPLALQTLRRFVSADTRLRLVGEASDGESAVSMIDSERPDVVFLDVQLPECSGLEVLERAGHRPAVVFTTAFSSYAVDAFSADAFDYLVKPFGRTRFVAAVDRVLRRLDVASSPREESGTGEGALRRIFARHGDVMVPIDLSDVLHIEGADDYALFFTAAGKHLVSMTMQELEQRLDRERFVRVHRQHIVNLDYVEALRPYDERRLLVCLRNGRQVIASRTGTRLLRGIVR